MKLPQTEVKFYHEVKSQTGLSSLRVSCKRALILEYKDYSKQQLKSELKKQKKDQNATPESIRYASKLLRSRIKLSSPESLVMNLSTDHD